MDNKTLIKLALIAGIGTVAIVDFVLFYRTNARVRLAAIDLEKAKIAAGIIPTPETAES